MGRRSRSRSRSRGRAKEKQSRSRGRAEEKSRKQAKRREPSAEKDDDSDGELPAWAKDDEDGDEEMSLEAKVALLEVENAKLKAENHELKKKLIQALNGKSGGAKEKKADPKPAAAPEQADDPAERRRKRMAAAASSPPREGGREAPRRHREPSPEKAPPPGEEGKNAVMLANDQMEAYNESIANNIPPEKRNLFVNEKMARFIQSFSEKVQILDLKTDKPVIKDTKTFVMRYSCVFRESGAKLKGSCLKRFYYDAMSRPTYVLDFEKHVSLVTAMAGTRPDGSLGVRDPRTEYLAVLYEEKGGKITRMWLKPDSEKLGMDPTAGEETLERTDLVKMFENKINELRGNPAGSKCGPRHFFNYHDIPTVG